jgi:hypothetical protein
VDFASHGRDEFEAEIDAALTQERVGKQPYSG